MSNKTISINPSLFSVGGSKTKKNREKKPKPTAVPLISPNVLKNKLLKRIKEHKQKETQDLENNKRKLDNVTVTNVEPIKNFEKFNDEFTDSINYLQTLSKQKKIDAEKKNYEDLQQRRKEELERRTIRNYHELNVNVQPRVNIDLPDELIQTTITEPFKINPPQKPDDVPYGVLKGGLKPSYREWARTHRNNIVTNPNSSLIIQGGMNSQQTARENRLNLLRQKIKNKSEETKVDPILTENLIKKPNPNMQQITSHVIQPIVQQSVQPVVEQTTGKLVATKHITKKTIKRKYTLGRSNIKRTVSVLIKDRGTRKKVLTAQKDLRRKNINDIKLYLREHNLIKTGSNAPNDVLRKLYESAMLSGEITNNNTETLLHNLSKEDKEL
jgi:hypothetical protein